MTRERLPQRRGSTAVDYQHDGADFHLTCSCFSDGRPGEIFVNSRKPNSAIDVLIGDAAILASLLLQHRVSLGEITHSLKRTAAGQPASPIGRALEIVRAL